jgi:hypothetical protein
MNLRSRLESIERALAGAGGRSCPRCDGASRELGIILLADDEPVPTCPDGGGAVDRAGLPLGIAHPRGRAFKVIRIGPAEPEAGGARG